jgi:methylase of polypeptide subunit release factors
MNEGTYIFSDDSALLGDFLSNIATSGFFLEIGVGGGGIISSLAKDKHFEMLVGTDIAELFHVRSRIPRTIDLIRADRASCFKSESFDFIATNPPYVPSEGISDIPTDGGRGGMQVPLGFLDSALEVIKKEGTIVVVLSSQDSLGELDVYCSRKNLNCKKVAERSLFFEKLYLFEISRKNDHI